MKRVLVLGMLAATNVGCASPVLEPREPTLVVSPEPTPAVAAASALAPVSAPPATVAPPAATEAPCIPDERKDTTGLPDRVAFTDAKTQRTGYKTRAGTIVIPARYADAGAFGAGGVAAVRLTNGGPNPWRFIGATGKELAVPFLFDNGPDYWQEGFARVVDARGKVGFIDANGKLVVSPVYDFAYPFCHGITKTARGGVGGYLDRAGQPTKGPANDARPLVPPSHSD